MLPRLKRMYALGDDQMAEARDKGEVKNGGEDGGEESAERPGGVEGVGDQYCMSEVEEYRQRIQLF